jgi:tungstate transport system permease protein
MFDSEIAQITLLSLQVSAIATIISLMIGLPFGTWLALGDFRGRSFILSIINTGMALPPCSRRTRGCDHALALRSTWKPAINLHADRHHHRADDHRSPCCYRLDCRRIGSAGPTPRQQLLGLGASRGQMVWYLWREARLPLLPR